MNRLMTWLKGLRPAKEPKRCPLCAVHIERVDRLKDTVELVRHERAEAERRGDEWRGQAMQAVPELVRLKQELAEARKPFKVVDLEEEDWTQADAEAWRHFLTKTETGQKLVRASNFLEQAKNREAVLRTDQAENNTGFARGWHHATYVFFKALTANPTPKEGTDTTEGEGAAAVRERLAP